MEKAEYLSKLPGAHERLKIFAGVDLLSPGAYEEAMTGCESVLHTASPFFIGSEENLVAPAVEGTRNVLSTCKKLGVKYVVLTSSTASVFANYGALSNDHIYTSNDWSPEDIIRQNKNYYCLSKTLAERLAWEMSQEEGCPYQLAVMNPTLILGPVLPGQPHLNTSQAFVVDFLDGSMPILENACRTLVDVRDVAEAHVAAIERDNVMGKRFLLISCSPHRFEIARVVRDAVPEGLKQNVPSTISETPPGVMYGQAPPLPILYDASPSVDILGIQYHTLEEMIQSSVETLLANGFDNKNQYSIEKLK